MRKPVSLDNGRSWPTRAAAIKFFRDLRDRYSAGSIVTDRSDHDDLLALVRRYDASRFEGPSKIGVGIDRFETRMNFTNGGRTIGFWIIRTDETETDFSFIRAVNEMPKRDLEQLADACRAAVAADLQTARIRYFTDYADSTGLVSCGVTGEPLAERDSAFQYIDQGFTGLVGAFAASQGWIDSVPLGVLTAPADAQTTTTFADPSAASAFRAYHRASARILIVAKNSGRRGIAIAAENQPVLKI